GTVTTLDKARQLPRLGERLETAFDGIREDWWALGHKLGQTPSGRLAHAPTAAAYNCDLGLMMAWTRLVENIAAGPDTCLVVCDDPWVFRQLSNIDGVTAGSSPGLFAASLKWMLRGFLARTRFAVRAALASLMLRSTRKNIGNGDASIIVYGHPDSNTDGHDAYFGPLMKEIPDLKRLMHTDADVGFTQCLAADGRTAGLHGWGSPLFALGYIFQRWKPVAEDFAGVFSWLVRRAVAKENATAAIASNSWQIHCQDRWLNKQCPAIVVWPWENHPWERALCRTARQLAITAKGYQHAVVGPHQFNASPATNPDGLESVPDKVICSGPAYHHQLIDWGVPVERMCIGGAFRIARFDGEYYDANGPVFVATSSIDEITNEMMRAVENARQPGRTFVVKTHPLYPQEITESKDVQRTPHTIPESLGISAVFYGTGTSGLEGLLAGVPTFRIRPDDRVALDVLPDCASSIAVTVDSLNEALNNAVPPPYLDWNAVYAPVDMDVWKKELSI
ncbi:MAG: hypothetical protein HOE26_06855, partial [Rhodospirillaceae bacterium]|nr:hypothetical protein [Rhodospirillaceae bacterium]